MPEFMFDLEGRTFPLQANKGGNFPLADYGKDIFMDLIFSHPANG